VAGRGDAGERAVEQPALTATIDESACGPRAASPRARPDRPGRDLGLEGAEVFRCRSRRVDRLRTCPSASASRR
jgi:hypothetical protein